MNTMSALVAILTYGLVVGIAGVMLALRERSRRRGQHAPDNYVFSLSNQGLHGRLKTDTGEELEVYLQKTRR